MIYIYIYMFRIILYYIIHLWTYDFVRNKCICYCYVLCNIIQLMQFTKICFYLFKCIISIIIQFFL